MIHAKQFEIFVNELKQEIEGGGKIIFSIEGKNGGIAFLEKMQNKLFMKTKINKIVIKLEIEGFSLQGQIHGMYNHNIHDKNNKTITTDTAYSLECLGITTSKLEELATEIIKEFPTESVLIYNYNTNKRYFFN